MLDLVTVDKSWTFTLSCPHFKHLGKINLQSLSFDVFSTLKHFIWLCRHYVLEYFIRCMFAMLRLEDAQQCQTFH